MVRVGMLWFDRDEKSTLEAKVLRAVEYYLNKYGKCPTLCIVHPSQVPEGGRVGELEVKGNKHIRPNHFWIGMNTNGGENE